MTAMDAVEHPDGDSRTGNRGGKAPTVRRAIQYDQLLSPYGPAIPLKITASDTHSFQR